jgi:hypothetical protein
MLSLNSDMLVLSVDLRPTQALIAAFDLRDRLLTHEQVSAHSDPARSTEGIHDGPLPTLPLSQNFYPRPRVAWMALPLLLFSSGTPACQTAAAPPNAAALSFLSTQNKWLGIHQHPSSLCRR